MWSQVRTGAFELVLDKLRTEAALVVVDCGFCLETGPGSATHRNQTTLQVLGVADQIVVVGRPEPVGLARLVRALHDLSDAVPGRDPVVVVNQTRTSLGWREQEVAATLHRLTGVEPQAYLPFDQAGLDLAAVSGRSPRESAPASPFVTRVEVLARTLVSRAGDRVVLAPAVP
jgi:Flp pilus assembly CpaE family ATPase